MSVVRECCNGTVVRPAVRGDMRAVADMIQELADFEKMPDGPKIGKAELERDGFDNNSPGFRCLIAETTAPDGAVTAIGYALYFPTYSTWEGLSCMLEDLYVKPAYREKGVGGMLFNHVAKMAVSGGSRRLDFHVLDWNPAARFYKAHGARDLSAAEQWRYYRLDGQCLLNAADNASSPPPPQHGDQDKSTL